MTQEHRKIKLGRVISDKMDKTVIVAVDWHRVHPKYGKPVRRTTKLTAHDVNNLCHVGDLVRIEETRPLSKTKRWRVKEILPSQEKGANKKLSHDSSSKSLSSSVQPSSALVAPQEDPQ